MKPLYTMKRQKLIDARLSRGLSPGQLAEELRVSYESIHKWESGRATPHPQTRKLIAAYFKMSEQELGLVPSQQIITTSTSVPSPLELSILMEPRRQALREILTTACASIFLSPYELLPKESQERLTRAMIHPSYLDHDALNDLSAVTTRYWHLLDHAPLDTLIGAVSAHYTEITQFLKDSHPAPIHKRLCVEASKNAQLLGVICHIVKERHVAEDYYKFALRVARSIKDTDLWALGAGHLAKLYLRWGDPNDALSLLQETQHLTIHNHRLSAWLLAVQAETYAEMHNMNDCLRLLDQSKSVTLPASLDDDIYSTGFNTSLAAGYEGACLVHLRQPERAMPVLEQSMALIDFPSLERYTRIIDIGRSHAQLGDPKKACDLLGQVLGVITERRSVSGLQRIYTVRTELHPWKDSAEVRELDERLRATISALSLR
jgi:transcriptional regulator with XRE-family HTH domain